MEVKRLTEMTDALKDANAQKLTAMLASETARADAESRIAKAHVEAMELQAKSDTVTGKLRLGDAGLIRGQYFVLKCACLCCTASREDFVSMATRHSQELDALRADKVTVEQHLEQARLQLSTASAQLSQVREALIQSESARAASEERAATAVRDLEGVRGEITSKVCPSLRALSSVGTIPRPSALLNLD